MNIFSCPLRLIAVLSLKRLAAYFFIHKTAAVCWYFTPASNARL